MFVNSKQQFLSDDNALAYIPANNLDDLMRKVFDRLIDGQNRVSATKGESHEIFGVNLSLARPRFRLSRSESRSILTSCLGELLWYLSGSDDINFIKYYLPDYGKYSDDKKTIHGAYGPRLFNSNGHNQIDNVISILKRKPSSRRAVIQLFEARDLTKDFKDIPCTCTIQLVIRNNRLHMMTFMRSNDVFFGLPHDIFSFTMLQEILARSLDVQLGSYKHAVGSLHLYKEKLAKAEQYLAEGFQDAEAMPVMPEGDPWANIALVLEAERNLRQGTASSATEIKASLPSYWSDIVSILEIYSILKRKGDKREVAAIKSNMHSKIYSDYTRKLEKQIRVKPIQPEFQFTEGGK